MSPHLLGSLLLACHQRPAGTADTTRCRLGAGGWHVMIMPPPLCNSIALYIEMSHVLAHWQLALHCSYAWHYAPMAFPIAAAFKLILCGLSLRAVCSSSHKCVQLCSHLAAHSQGNMLMRIACDKQLSPLPQQLCSRCSVIASHGQQQCQDVPITATALPITADTTNGWCSCLRGAVCRLPVKPSSTACPWPMS